MSRERRPPPPLEPPAGAPPRWTRRPFPAYRHVPRRTPHPVSDPAGHSYGLRDQPVVLGGRRLPRDWRRVEEYLRAVDLFNAAYFWEAHESWESVWHAVERSSVTGRFLQGLIQASAALLQRHCGRPTGARNLLSRAAGNLEPVHLWLAGRRRADFMGLEVAAWQTSLAGYLDDATRPFPFLRLAGDAEDESLVCRTGH